MLITDQKALSRLALSLRVDIEFLLKSINSNPADLDEAARSHFLQRIFRFLRNATDLTEEKVRSHPLFRGTALASAPVRSASVPFIPPPHPHIPLGGMSPPGSTPPTRDLDLTQNPTGFRKHGPAVY